MWLRTNSFLRLHAGYTLIILHTAASGLLRIPVHSYPFSLFESNFNKVASLLPSTGVPRKL